MKNQKENRDSFITNDLGLSATLVSYNYPLDLIDKNNPRKVVFHFRKDKAIEKIINGYWSNDITVNPQIYFNSIKMLKNRIYSA